MSQTQTTTKIDAAARLSVLIVEDEAAARQASGHYLNHCGHRVATAENAEEAAREAGRRRPDVVICDWRLGRERDGVDVARELQQKYGSSIVFVSAYLLDQLRYAARDMDVARYLRKPISLSLLAEVISGIEPTMN